ncbi:MAG: hypothetical protein GX593_14565 [Actinomycetales bacterium]|nr:hypothetical protein [Actinomycetales bacterium]
MGSSFANPGSESWWTSSPTSLRQASSTAPFTGSPTRTEPAVTDVRRRGHASVRRVDGVDGHDIDCKVDGFGQMQLKSSVVKKA